MLPEPPLQPVPLLLDIRNRLDALERRVEAIHPASEWVPVRQACEEYLVCRETLRKLEVRGLIDSAPELPKRYSRRSLDRHFFGVVR